MARVSAEWMSKGQLAMDDSRGRIAEMMIQGTTMGIVKTIRHLNDYQGRTATRAGWASACWTCRNGTWSA